jgi:hypothetical protein
LVIALITPPAKRPYSAETPETVGGGLLDGVLDEQRQLLAADVLVDHHAVERPQVLEGHATGDGHAAGRRVDHRARGEQHRGVEVAVERQVLDLVLGVARRAGGRLRDGATLTGDDDLLGHRREAHLDVDAVGQGGRDAHLAGRRGEALELVGDGVRPRRQEGQLVAAVLPGDGDAAPLQVRGGRGDRDARQRGAVGVGDPARDLARRVLRLRRGRRQQPEGDRGDERRTPEATPHPILLFDFQIVTRRRRRAAGQGELSKNLLGTTPRRNE